MPNSDHHVTLSIDADYNYTYSGGNKGNGNVDNKTGQGQSKIHISLEAASSFNIVDAHFSGPGQGNLTYNVNGNERKITINNTCATNADVKYTINVVDTTNGRNVACDPKIVNQ